MDVILLDWTRMGRSYCLAGAVLGAGTRCIVRPLLGRNGTVTVRNSGWSAYLLDGHTRWEVFELVAPEPVSPEPPHLEDLWVRSLHPRRRLATSEQRRAILTATRPPVGEPLFGAPLAHTRAAAFLPPGTGCRSLVTIVVPSAELRFHASHRSGAAEPDLRVEVPVDELAGRQLPIKDHHLLRRVEQAAPDPEGQARALEATVIQMGEQVAVRLGLSRAFSPGGGDPRCWVMADGFFSFADPQS